MSNSKSLKQMIIHGKKSIPEECNKKHDPKCFIFILESKWTSI